MGAPFLPRAATAVAVVAATLALAGCGGDQNILRPESPEAGRISRLFWITMTGSWIGLGVVAVFLLLGWFRRNRSGLPGGGGDRAGGALVVVLGVGVPIVVLSMLFWYADVRAFDATAAPIAGSGQLQVEVTGHQWFWEVRYPGTQAVTANEIHIPTRTRVELVAKSADVIHSFWVPRLNRKIDMIPGHPNRIVLYADEPGTYRGRCSEFCGLQHANMQLFVVAEPQAAFSRWLAEMEAPAPAPIGADAARGQQVFLSNACAGCHAIRGTAADGSVGPDLTHLMTRKTLAAGTIPNSEGDLAGWVLDPQHVKPGNKMTALPLPGPDFRALLAYLESLR